MMAQPLKKPLPSAAWWVLFGVATYLLSLCLERSRAFFLAPGWDPALTFAGPAALLAVLLVLLVYDSYVSEKLKDKVQRPIKLFEWLYARQYSNHDAGGGAPRP